MTDIFEKGLIIGFTKRSIAEDYIYKIKSAIYKIDVIPLMDVLKFAQRPIGDDWRLKSLKYGYSRKETRKLKPVKTKDGYIVIFPPPGRMIRDENGYWTTEKVEVDKGG